MDDPSCRYRICFAKNEAMRFISHLDLHRALERTFRRAQLPLAYSKGYNPRPRINLASALPLGMMGECELVDVWLTEPIPIETFMASIEQAAPPGLVFLNVKRIDLRAPTLQSQLVSTVFRIRLENGPSQTELQMRIDNLMAATSLPRSRRGKSYDLRPLIENLELVGNDQEPHRLIMTLSALEGSTGRADEVLQALGYDPTRADIVRTKLVLLENRET